MAKTATATKAVKTAKAAKMTGFPVEKIPLANLMAWPGNLRKTRTPESIEEKARSIEAVGLLQSLVVRAVGTKGKYEVIAGETRRLGLEKLREEGKLTKNYTVTCQVAPADADPEEISLTENVVRDPMNPLEEFAAWKALADKGRPIPDIAARFGVSESVVLKRLKLARLSPVILDAYREDRLTLDALQGFAATDDWDRQEKIYANLSHCDHTGYTIRRILSEGKVSLNDSRVKLVTIEAYEQAGGVVERDLFSDNVYLPDVDLLNGLVERKFAEAKEKVKADGWGWVEGAPLNESVYEASRPFSRVQGEKTLLSPELMAERDALEKQYAELEAEEEATRDENEHLHDDDAEEEYTEDLDDEQEFDEDEGEEDDHAVPPVALTANQSVMKTVQARLQEIDEIEEFVVFRPEVKKAAGVMLALQYDGSIRVLDGLVRKEDQKAIEEAVPDFKQQVSRGLVSTPKAPKGPYAANLVETLTQHKTAAIQAELAKNPHVALASVVYSLLKTNDHSHGYWQSQPATKIAGTPAYLPATKGTKPEQYLEGSGSEVKGKLPKSHKDWWGYLLGQADQELLQLLAYFTALTVDGVEKGNAGARDHANDLIRALEFDLARWFEPTAENFLKRVPKAVILQALEEANCEITPTVLAMKKRDLVPYAEAALKGKGYVPEPMRPKTASDDSCEDFDYDDEEEEVSTDEEEDEMTVAEYVKEYAAAVTE